MAKSQSKLIKNSHLLTAKRATHRQKCYSPPNVLLTAKHVTQCQTHSPAAYMHFCCIYAAGCCIYAALLHKYSAAAYMQAWCICAGLLHTCSHCFMHAAFLHICRPAAYMHSSFIYTALLYINIYVPGPRAQGPLPPTPPRYTPG